MASAYAVRDAVDGDAARWNAFLDRQPSARPLAYYEWRGILRAAYGLDTHFFIAERDGEIAGILPVYVSRSLRGKRRLFSLRFGLNAENGSAAKALLDAALRRARERGAVSWLIGSALPFADALPAPVRRKTVMLPFNGDDDANWRNLRDKSRNMIRKAEKAGLRVEHGAELVDTLYDLYATTMARKALPFHARRYFRALVRGLGPRIDLIGARREGRIVAAMAMLCGTRIACYPYQAASEEGRDTGAIQLLNWAAMRHARARGAAALDMGESAEDSPVFRSKVNFGGIADDIYYWNESSGRAATDAAAPKAETRPRPAFAARLLHGAPMGVRKLLGPALHRRGRVV
jgi:hypothetical protein